MNTIVKTTKSYLNIKRFLKLALFCVLFITFMYFYSSLDRRTDTNHKPYHNSMVIAAFQPDGSFLALPYTYLQQHPVNNTSFLAQAPSGEKEKNGNETISYKIIEQQKDQQIIETTLRTPNQITIARYTATHSTVIPIESRVYHFQFLIMATLSALIIILLIQLFSKWQQRRRSTTSSAIK
jgi:hypothetical protein